MAKKIFKKNFILYLSMLFMGACGLAYEYTISKVASDLLGNSVQQWAIIIGVMMFFMGIGADVQKYVNDKALIDKFIFAEIWLGILGAFSPIVILHFFGLYRDYATLILYFFICSIGLLIGFEIPLLIRINESYTEKLKLNLGNVLQMDYLGSLVGSIVWVFVMIRYFSMTRLTFILGLVNITIAFVVMLIFLNVLTYKKTLLGFIAFSVLLVGWGFWAVPEWTSYSEQFLYHDRIIFAETTPYQHIVLTQSKSKELSCYINGNLQFNSFDEHIYHENLVHPVMNIAFHKKKVLVLGGGDGLAVREILKYPEVQSITVCDIDPQMTKIASSHPKLTKMNQNSFNHAKVHILKNNHLKTAGNDTLVFQNGNKPYQNQLYKGPVVQIVNLDAALFIEQIQGKYDVIIIDFPDPNTPELAKLYSRKFYIQLAKKLSKDGFFVQQSTSPVYSKESFLCIGRTMNSTDLIAIPYHDHIPSFGDWGFWIGGLKKVYQKEDMIHLLEDCIIDSIKTKYLTTDLVKSNLNFGKNGLKAKSNEINTILNNKVFELYFKGWNYFE